MARVEAHWRLLGDESLEIELQGKRCRIVAISDQHFVKIVGLTRSITEVTYTSLIAAHPEMSEKLLELMYSHGNLNREAKYKTLNFLFSQLEKYPDIVSTIKLLPVVQKVLMELKERPKEVAVGEAGKIVSIPVNFENQRGLFMGIDVDGICMLKIGDDYFEVGLIPLLLQNLKKAGEILHNRRYSGIALGRMNYELITTLELDTENPKAKRLLKNPTLLHIKDSHRHMNGEYVSFKYQESEEGIRAATSVKEAIVTGRKINMKLRPLHNKIRLIS